MIAIEKSLKVKKDIRIFSIIMTAVFALFSFWTLRDCLHSAEPIWIMTDIIACIADLILLFLVNYYFLTKIIISNAGIAEVSIFGHAVKHFRWEDIVFCDKAIIKCPPPANDSVFIVVSSSPLKKDAINGTAYRYHYKTMILVEYSSTNYDIVSQFFKAGSVNAGDSSLC